MGTILKLHRGPSTYMTAGAGANHILQEGEIFVEYPDAGLSAEGAKIKVGDGVSLYSALPYINLGGSGGGGSTEEPPIMPINPTEDEKKNGSIWIEEPGKVPGSRSYVYIMIDPDPSEIKNGSMYF